MAIVVKQSLAFLSLVLCLAVCTVAESESIVVGVANEGQNASLDNIMIINYHTWCIAKPSTAIGTLQSNLNECCKHPQVDCKVINPGGSCYEPNNYVSHASMAMNLYYKAFGKNPRNCDFNGSGLIITQDPSKLPLSLPTISLGSMASYPYGVTPTLEQLWREEVLYLHSLWHEGPPPRNPKPQPNSNDIGSSSFTAPRLNSNNLGASSSTTFKKKKKKKRAAKKNVCPEYNPQSDHATGPAIAEVQVKSTELHQETVWPESNLKSDQATRPATAEGQVESTAFYLQQKSLKACQNFFLSKVSSDDDKEENLVDANVVESEEFKFFLGIFTDDSCLKSYYEKNWERGEFRCLVCGGIGKRFKNCLALVKHSIEISKTKRKVAHRAFGKAICRVLGWEIHQLPNIVLSSDGPLGRSMAKAKSEVGAKKDHYGLHQNDIDNETVENMGPYNGKEMECRTSWQGYCH
ncbi:hypothetical protein NE237_012086 [Protea cynaroides]|uniref:X8 domain-containing protein n=1 Tax=Protea cynaroides TaxID=273540 RepID=A0A9Q0GWV5_9MAGN|nr:hypothetical protein NE237_012086 [Protea cynaroides]